MMRNVLLVTIAMALALALWLALRQGSGPAQAVARPSLAATDGPRAAEPAPQAAERAGATESRESVEVEPRPAAERIKTVLAVRVVAREDGEPLADVGVFVRRTFGRALSARTGTEGRVELEVPEDFELIAGVWPDPGRHGDASKVLPALARGERVELELRVATRPDQVFYGRLVDDETGEPVSPAVLHTASLGSESGSGHAGHERGPGAAPVEADGRFRLEIGTWDLVLLCVHAPGWSLATVQLSGGHDAPARERIVRLTRAGELAVDVVDGEGRALEEIQVRVTANGFELQQRDSATPLFGADDPRWEGRTGPDGRVVLSGLPARAGLRLTAARGREELRTLDVPELEPGESRVLELRLGGGARVVGEAVEADGRPLPDVEVWLVEEAQIAYLRRGVDEPTARTRTDAVGRFLFEGVHAGGWSAAIAPQAADVPPQVRLSSVATPLEVPESGEVSVRLVAHQGLTIEGHVVDATGAGVEGLAVWGRAREPWGRFDARSDAEGRFTLAGFAPGEVELEAREAGAARFGPSAPVTAPAGARDVVLRVSAAAALSGRVLAPEGAQLLHANLLVNRSDGAVPLEDLSLRRLFGPSFEITGLSAGVWGLSVTTPEGLVGVLGGINLSPGQRREDLVLRLEPSAELRVRDELRGPLSGCMISVHTDGACVGWDGVQTGATAVFRVPGGRLRVLATRGATTVRELVLDVLAGEVVEIVLE